ncbi:hypothetical protein [Longimicrobium terrae]|uniref:Uncharacterized protein n=1 Tax=Longimicrobium terrae TaxID=1639882 RepID=A0A841H2S0_9BACT|nr:hypothetical protein [Longimicrobium terrae]MBB4637845.1 hypothetical protein [Longimicrobium terrae]MBB6072300.1 hypothetical protein [Longimicrobium terrae]NNC31220.1 hypothetical protein [Longimicrobium terrae]
MQGGLFLVELTRAAAGGWRVAGGGSLPPATRRAVAQSDRAARLAALERAARAEVAHRPYRLPVPVVSSSVAPVPA